MLEMEFQAVAHWIGLLVDWLLEAWKVVAGGPAVKEQFGLSCPGFFFPLKSKNEVNWMFWSYLPLDSETRADLMVQPLLPFWRWDGRGGRQPCGDSWDPRRLGGWDSLCHTPCWHWRPPATPGYWVCTFGFPWFCAEEAASVSPQWSSGPSHCT